MRYRGRIFLLGFFCYTFLKEKTVKKHNHDETFDSFSALLDKGAEVFTKKMFKHSQSKSQERWGDMEQDRRGKKSFTIRSKSRRDEFDLS
jgi:hypothetical protein